MVDTKKPASLDEAMGQLDAAANGGEEEKPATAAPEGETADDFTANEEGAEEGSGDALDEAAEHGKDPNAIPDWIMFPQHAKWKIPPNAGDVFFLRFKAEWMPDKSKGDRTVIFWCLNDNEEKMAGKRTRGDDARWIGEMTKACVRAMGSITPGEDKATVPMTMSDWTGTFGPGSVDRFWNEIGPKCRSMLKNLYHRTHSLTAEETADFFLNCMTARSAVAG